MQRRIFTEVPSCGPGTSLGSTQGWPGSMPAGHIVLALGPGRASSEHHTTPRGGRNFRRKASERTLPVRLRCLPSSWARKFFPESHSSQQFLPQPWSFLSGFKLVAEGFLEQNGCLLKLAHPSS
uniref:Uncharacterized protein n=1 Tax=Rousettus aegyptiacus TaxID=9407 RepID=A0A7J8D6X9_ROUAE|nr:hypothetical protein HJG63_008876 [Rousettus aegyptiacus]